jgi:hypothetical protein
MLYQKNGIVTALLLLILIGNSSAKPKLKVANDGFPAGQNTPEGAATDLARAFMTRDAFAFRKVCIRHEGPRQVTC